jgi:hypothetical protein
MEDDGTRARLAITCMTLPQCDAYIGVCISRECVAHSAMPRPLEMMLSPDVLLSDGAIAPFRYGDHTGAVFELSDDARPISRSEPDRV